MTAKDEDVKTQLNAMVTRLKEESTKKSLSRKESLALRLEEQYPDDIGVFACFFLNYIELQVLWRGRESLFSGLFFPPLPSFLPGLQISCRFSFVSSLPGRRGYLPRCQ